MRFRSIDLDLRSSFFLAVLGLLVTATACRAEGASPAPPTKPRAVPAFEKLPHTPLPKGEFIAWCGDRERYLLATDGRYVDAYDGSTKISAPSPTRGPAQCDVDGRYIAFVENDAGRVRKFELETGKSEILATFQKQSYPSIKVSFSPDLKIVASTRPLQLTAEAGELRTINLSEAIGHPVSEVVWAPDSSKFFATDSDTIDVLDMQGKKIGGGRLLKGSYVRTGWFDVEQKSLFLFLVTEADESGGPLVRCRIANWRCVRVKERVEQASGGGKGFIGTVGPLDPREPSDQEWQAIYSRYAAELRDNSFRLLFRQEFTLAAGQTMPRLYVSPTGATAVLSWRLTERLCPDPANNKCRAGWILDIGKAIK
ncbi:hypothetical protein [uncultured Bradyrhizobium sp.]|jgi:hypothetical protein|uniref:hypothetical protein n=1 Tax=uncultured Bradyrhizobium sp. TaxID=199684 RepID=UPI002635DF11|nr:hypothetical protein [uncultured Bradyrhizobium sp.]